MIYAAKDYSRLIGMPGFSDTLLKNHFTLYQGYVANVNKVLDNLSRLLQEGQTGSPEYAELKRRLGWEWNGMRLHELYFENLGGKTPPDPSLPVMPKLEASFGGSAIWEKDFRATGSMRGIGWVVLYQDPEADRLVNFWINEHDTAHPAGGRPLLVMDVFEHAYLTDYGLKKADYIDSFVKNIDWNVVASRMK